MTASDIRRAISGRRLSFGSEADLHQLLSSLFTAAGIPHEHEFIISPKDRLDFLVDGHLAVEVKVEGGHFRIMRQMERYAAHDAITEVVLIQPKPMQLPTTMCGKPVSCIPIYMQML